MVSAIAIVMAGCGFGSAAAGSLSGKLTVDTITPGAPSGTELVHFSGQWENQSGKAVTMPSTRPVILRVGGHTIYPWQYRASMRAQFKKQCQVVNGKTVCTKPKVLMVTVNAGSSFIWAGDFDVPKDRCHAAVTIRIQGLPGDVHTRIPCQ